jgi:hypothetical protein
MFVRENWSAIPGTVIAHSSAATGKYIGSPGLAILPDGSYVASHDHFGPGSTEHGHAETWIYRSQDKGITWVPISQISDAFWSNLFTHRGVLYLFGTSRHYGYAVIRRSDDGGLTWTTPTSSKTGLLTTTPEYHCAPMPVLEHNGHLYRAFEHRSPGTGWGTNFTSGVFRARSTSDLLDARSWEQSNFLRSDSSWNNGDMKAWLEGNITVSPAGQLVNILRVQTTSSQEKAAICTLNARAMSLAFEPQMGFIPFPGGAKKFCIRRHPRTGRYYAIASAVHPADKAEDPGSMRNCLVLLRSDDMYQWEMQRVLLYHPDVHQHGFQYVEWQFDGNDIVFVSRTAFHDGVLPAHRAHDANFLTFHRISHFERSGDTPLDGSRTPSLPLTMQTGNVEVEGHGFVATKLQSDRKLFTNRDYQIGNIPENLVGKPVTSLAGGAATWLWVNAKRTTEIYFLTGAAPSKQTTQILQASPVTTSLFYTDAQRSPLHLYKRIVKQGERVYVPQLSWTGTAVVIP